MTDYRQLLERSPAAPPDDAELARFLDFAGRLADAAGPAILPHFRAAIAVDDKGAAGHYDPVTEADRGAEAAMRALIREQFPEHSVFGEEHGYEAGASPLTWVLDPLDGTRSFITGMLHWGTLIALWDGARPLLGVVHQPYTGERFTGSRLGAVFSDRAGSRALRSRRATGLSAAVLYTTHPALLAAGAERAAFQALSERVRLTRYGGDCYNYCMLAHGLVDLVVEAGLAPYDIMPLVPLIEAAGGVVTDWEGGPAWFGGRVLAAGDPALHREALEVLRAGLLGRA